MCLLFHYSIYLYFIDKIPFKETKLYIKGEENFFFPFIIQPYYFVTICYNINLYNIHDVGPMYNHWLCRSYIPCFSSDTEQCWKPSYFMLGDFNFKNEHNKDIGNSHEVIGEVNWDMVTLYNHECEALSSCKTISSSVNNLQYSTSNFFWMSGGRPTSSYFLNQVDFWVFAC